MVESVKNSVYELRNKAGMTQSDLAALVGVTRQTIIAIEKGNYTPSVLLALRFAKVFSSKGGSASGGKKSISVEDIFYF